MNREKATEFAGRIPNLEIPPALYFTICGLAHLSTNISNGVFIHVRDLIHH